jgi:hypothetical protein
VNTTSDSKCIYHIVVEAEIRYFAIQLLYLRRISLNCLFVNSFIPEFVAMVTQCHHLASWVFQWHRIGAFVRCFTCVCVFSYRKVWNGCWINSRMLIRLSDQLEQWVQTRFYRQRTLHWCLFRRVPLQHLKSKFTKYHDTTYFLRKLATDYKDDNVTNNLFSTIQFYYNWIKN